MGENVEPRQLQTFYIENWSSAREILTLFIPQSNMHLPYESLIPLFCLHLREVVNALTPGTDRGGSEVFLPWTDRPAWDGTAPEPCRRSLAQSPS